MTGVQTCALPISGQSYALTFNLGVDQSIGQFNGPIGVTAAAGSTSQVFNNFNPVGTGSIWQSFTLDFTASSASTLISIQGEQGDQFIGLDEVAVNATAPSTPETSTWAMMLIGFAGFAFVGYRRAKKNDHLSAAV